MYGILESLFIETLNMSLTASVIILAVLLARILLRKAPQIFSYVLWAAVLFRLLCPFSFTSTFSLLGFLQNESAAQGRMTYIPENIGFQMNPAVNLPIPAVNDAVNSSLPAGNPAGSVNPMQIILWLGARLWLLGIVVIVIYSIFSLLRLQKQLKKAVWEKDNIYRIAGMGTPFVCGILHPRIYLPKELDREEPYILLHEQIHIRRKDHIFRLLSWLALCLHWFNPLVWTAFSFSERDMEMSCDEAVIRENEKDIKKEYSASLLAAASGCTSRLPLAFGEKDTKSRIKNILRYQRPARILVGAAAVLCAILAVMLLANPKEKSGFAKYEDLTNKKVYYGVIGYDELNSTAHFVVNIPEYGSMEIPDAEIIYPYIEIDFEDLEAGDLVRIVFPRGVSPLILETYPGMFSESAESIAVMGRGSFVLYPRSDLYLFTVPLGLAPEAQQGDTLEIYHHAPEIDGQETTLLASVPVLEVTEDAYQIWIELTPEDTATFLAEFGFGIQCRLIPHTLSEEEAVQESGNTLLTENTASLTPESLLNENIPDGTYRIFIRSISRSSRGIDRYLVDSWNDEENGAPPFLAFTDSCAFLANEEKNSVRYEAVPFDTFANIVEAGAACINVPCAVTFENNLIVQAVLDSSWYDTGISYQPFLRDTWYEDVQDILNMTGDEALNTYYTLARTEQADISESRGTETIEIYTGNIGDGDSGLVLFKSWDGEILYSEGAHAARAGWNNIYLGQMEGTDFLMTVHVEDRDSYGEYSYQVFRLGAYGQIMQIAGSSFTFGDPFIYDDDLFHEWADDMSYYLEQSRLLLSTQDGEIRTDSISEAEKYNYETLRKEH